MKWDEIAGPVPTTGADFWKGVAERLASFSNALGERLPQSTGLPSPNGIYARWRAIWRAHDAETQVAWERWLDAGDFPSDPKIIFLLWVRVNSAHALARFCSLPMLTSAALFFAPAVSIRDAIETLLGEWWRMGGDVDGLRRMNELQYLGKEWKDGQPVRTPKTTWEEVFKCLAKLWDALLPYRAQPRSIVFPAKAEDWPKCWQPFANDVEAALEVWLSNGTLPENREVGFWFWMRVAAAFSLLRQVEGVEKFEPRGESVHVLIRYLLGPWWGLKGAFVMWNVETHLAGRGAATKN